MNHSPPGQEKLAIAFIHSRSPNGLQTQLRCLRKRDVLRQGQSRTCLGGNTRITAQPFVSGHPGAKKNTSGAVLHAYRHPSRYYMIKRRKRSVSDVCWTPLSLSGGFYCRASRTSEMVCIAAVGSRNGNNACLALTRRVSDCAGC